MYIEEYNHKRIQVSCPDCKNNPCIVDNHREETYCPVCGLILQDNTLPSITSIIEEVNKDDMKIREVLWRRRLH
jgi:transcription initiation factor TFIIIB Brf1 subunit/transcription initiation factor TFIIB